MLKRKFTVLILFCLTLIITGCAKILQTNDFPFVYKNELLGFQMSFPVYWDADFLLFEEYEDGVVILAEFGDHYRSVGSILRVDLDVLNDPQNVNLIASPHHILGDSGNYRFVLFYQGDIIFARDAVHRLRDTEHWNNPDYTDYFDWVEEYERAFPMLDDLENKNFIFAFTD